MFFKYKKNIDSFTKKLNKKLVLYKIDSILAFTIQEQNLTHLSLSRYQKHSFV